VYIPCYHQSELAVLLHYGCVLQSSIRGTSEPSTRAAVIRLLDAYQQQHTRALEHEQMKYRLDNRAQNTG